MSAYKHCHLLGGRGAMRVVLMFALLFSCLSAQAAVTFSLNGSDERVRQGEKFTVEWVLTNTGPTTELNVDVVLIFPQSVDRLWGPYMEGAVCTGTYCDPGDTVTWSLGNLSPGQTRSVYFAPTVSNNGLDGSLVWDATVFTGSTTAANSIWTQQIDSTSALELAIESDQALIAAGGTINYSVAFGNSGITELSGATLTVPLPSGTSVLSAPGGVVSASDVSWSLGNIAVNGIGRRSLTLATPATSLPGTHLRLQNASLAGTYLGLTRSVSANHVALIGSSPVAIELRTQEGTALPGEPELLEIVVGNNSGVVQQNVVVTLMYPLGVDRYWGPYMENAVCAGTYCDAGDIAEWTIGTLLPGESWSASFAPSLTSAVKQGYPIFWQARVAVGADVKRREQIITLSGNTAPELSVSADSSQIEAGKELTWWFNYGNRGVAPLEMSALDVPVPAGVTVVDTHGGSNNGGNVSWFLGSLPAGSHGRQALTVRVDSSLVNGQLIALNGAALSGSYFGLVQATEAEHVVDIGNSPLQIELRALPGVPGPSEGVAFEFLVSNKGTNVETGVTLDALYPYYIDRVWGPYMEAAVCATTYCDPTDHVVWNVGNLLPGETRSITFGTSVTSDAELGDSSDWLARVAANGSKRRRADLSVGITDKAPQLAVVSSRTLALAGQNIDYTFTLGNPSGSVLANPEFEVTLPENAELVAATGASISGREVLWQLDDLPADTVGEVKMTLRVPVGTPSGSLLELRNAELRGSVFGVTQSTKVSHAVAIGSSPLALSIVVNPGFAAPGEGLNVQLEVTNTGSTLQQSVELDLLYPLELDRLVTTNMSGATCNGAYCNPGDHAAWALGNMLPGEVRTITFGPDINGSLAEGTIVNWQARVAVADGKQRRAHTVVGVGSQFDFDLSGGGATPSAEVSLISSCLAGNGRVDLNIVNSKTAMSTYRLELQGLTARQSVVMFEDWGRIPISGRLPGSYLAVVKRDGQTILAETLNINCDVPTPNVSAPEVTIMNACRASNGYILFQMVNAGDSAKPYVIEFEGVNNRSTTAAAFGQAIRATTGRPDGTYDYLVRSGSTIVDSGEITVDCD